MENHKAINCKYEADESKWLTDKSEILEMLQTMNLI